MAIIRRFRQSPRMVVTVATLGITQLLVVLGILVPRWWGRTSPASASPSPIDWKLTLVGELAALAGRTRASYILSANDIIAMVVAPLAHRRSSPGS